MEELGKFMFTVENKIGYVHKKIRLFHIWNLTYNEWNILLPLV